MRQLDTRITAMTEYRRRSKSVSDANGGLLTNSVDLVIDSPLTDTYKHYADFLHHTHTQNNDFIDEIEGILNSFDTLLNIHDSVTSQTTDFQSESTALIDSLSELETLHTDLTSKFAIFNSLDSIVKKLNTVNNSKIVLKSSFHDLLVSLDQSIHFVNDPAHADYKDITIYKHRFKQCMIRALTLIRNYIINYIRSIENKISTQIKPENTQALLYVTFVDNISNVYPLFIELYQRAAINNIDADDDSNDDYYNLLDDVYNQYTKTRSHMMNQHIVQPFLTSTDFTNTPLVEFTNTNLNFFTKLIDRETEAFKTLFFLPTPLMQSTSDNTANATAVTTYLEHLLDPIYYILRNKILRESNIDNLCELISLINTYSTPSFHAPLLRPILHDAQTRLVFRVQKYIDIHITKYKTTGKELVITKTATLIYPPIEHSIDVLNKIYGLLNSAVFDDIASNIVHLCIASLENFTSPHKNVEHQLYAIKSLLTLKDTIHNNFEILHFRRETTLDFSGLRTVLSKSGTVYDKLVGSLPTIVNDIVDVHVELQVSIRKAVHEFIQIAVTRLDGKISEQEIKRIYSQIREFVNDETAEILMDGIHDELDPQYHTIWINAVKEVLSTAVDVVDLDSDLISDVQKDLDNISV